MRLYANLEEAILETRRDLAKSPQTISSRVQGTTIEAMAREALGYTYTVAQMPETVDEVAELGLRYGLIAPEELSDWKVWLHTELLHRVEWFPGSITEHLHPGLKKHLEGREPSYAYTDRLAGMTHVLTETLWRWPDTRRAFWPMFVPEDALRATRVTRVPCTLGYQMLIRKVAPGDHRLHVVYLERSCDFDHFWLSDIWLASRLRHEVYQKLLERSEMGTSAPVKGTLLENLREGGTTHMIVSLHSFEQVSQELY